MKLEYNLINGKYVTESSSEEPDGPSSLPQPSTSQYLFVGPTLEEINSTTIEQDENSGQWPYQSGYGHLNILEGITTIGTGAFNNASGFTSVTIPNTVTEIGDSAFSYCNFTSIVIPESVTLIDSSAFYGCMYLESITCLATTPPELGEDAFANIADNYTIYVPADSLGAYQSAWSDYNTNNNIVAIEE